MSWDSSSEDWPALQNKNKLNAPYLKLNNCFSTIYNCPTAVRQLGKMKGESAKVAELQAYNSARSNVNVTCYKSNIYICRTAVRQIGTLKIFFDC